MSLMPFMSVVVPVFEQGGLLEGLLMSLLRQSYPRERYEVIVIDDGSRDGTLRCAESFRHRYPGGVKVFSRAHRGPAAARNAGIKEAQGAIVAFVDADCAAAPEWLETLAKSYEDGDALLAGVGGDVQILQDGRLLSAYCRHVHDREIVSDTGGIPEPNYLMTANASYRRDVLEAAGGFNEKFDFPGGEDQDISYRIKKMGYRLAFNPKAVVFHHPKENLARLLRTQFNYGRGEAYLWGGRDMPGRAFRQGLRTFLAAAKLPLEMAAYYRQGFGPRKSAVFSVLDWMRKVSFSAGIFAGSLAAVRKGC